MTDLGAQGPFRGPFQFGKPRACCTLLVTHGYHDPLCATARVKFYADLTDGMRRARVRRVGEERVDAWLDTFVSAAPRRLRKK